MRQCAIYGIGNVLLGDDGVGPATATAIDQQWMFGPGVTVEDLGTPSLSLPGYLAGKDVVIVIDAVAGGGEPGSLRIFSKEEIMAAPTGIRVSPHEPSINDALVLLDFAGSAPPDVVLVGVVAQTLEGGVNLSPPVARAVPAAVEAVIGELGKRGFVVARRDECQL